MFSGLSSLLIEPWWTWDPTSAGIGDVAYRWFNLAEAAAWFVFGLMVFHRWRRHRHSGIEVVYAAAFVLFGLTDVREAWQQSALLLAVKGAVLAGLLTLRCVVRHRYYPESMLL
jgi:hypothetical protein